VLNKHTYIANMSNSLSWTTPEWQFEYDVRSAYDPDETHQHRPLDGPFWHWITQRMERGDKAVADMYNLYERKSSVRTQACDDDCVKAKICWMRSGSAELGRRCPEWKRY